MPIICDFCSSPNPTGRDIIAKEFTMAVPAPNRPNVTVNVVESPRWAVCTTCRALVDANEWDKLKDRVVETSGIPDEHRAGYRAMLDTMYAKLREGMVST